MLVDDYGRVALDNETLKTFIYNGGNVKDVFVIKDDQTEHFNELCDQWSKEEYKLSYLNTVNLTPEEYHKKRQSEWRIPKEYLHLNIDDFLFKLCSNEKEIQRVKIEMELYKKYKLVPVLRLMVFLVDHWRKNNILWGVGRGSSVASYVLFLIGIHKIDSIKYDLDIKEFLK